MKAADLYEKVTDQIVATIESGDAGQWTAPWHGTFGIPRNAQTGNTYRGGNILALWIAADAAGYTDPIWATYRQWETLGAQVRKGERATYAIKWIVKDAGDSGAEPGETSLNELDRRAFPKAFALFNASQVDGYDLPAKPSKIETIAYAETFFANVGATVTTGAPSYSSARDTIALPPIGAFKSAEDYYATSAHEHGHWTGHKTRLDRQLANRFGSDAYAAEELIAELTAAFVCAHLGIATTPRPDHAQYLASWVKVLKADSRAIFAAATAAQAAADYLTAAAAEKEMAA